jgi:hypothetical protein
MQEIPLISDFSFYEVGDLLQSLVISVVVGRVLNSS